MEEKKTVMSSLVIINAECTRGCGKVFASYLFEGSGSSCKERAAGSSVCVCSGWGGGNLRL